MRRENEQPPTKLRVYTIVPHLGTADVGKNVFISRTRPARVNAFERLDETTVSHFLSQRSEKPKYLAQILLAPGHLKLQIPKQRSLVLHALEDIVHLFLRELSRRVSESDCAIGRDLGGDVVILDLQEKDQKRRE